MSEPGSHRAPSPTPAAPGPVAATIPVFVLAPSQRSGTNFLYRALLEHPDCAPARQPGEDFLLYEADHLARYVQRVAGHWNPDWNRGGARAADLALGLGAGLVAHLRPDTPARAFVTKTPSVRNLPLLPRFLPDARVLVVLRDGRDVVESGVRGLGWSYDQGFRRWATGAGELADFLEAGKAGFVHLVRFETLVADPGPELRRALQAAGLDPERYPEGALERLPVYGSSVFRGGESGLHWKPVPRDEGFQPVGRWRAWDRRLRLRWWRACGALAERLGYDAGRPDGGALAGLATRLGAWLDRR